MDINPAWLAPTYYMDYEAPSVRQFVANAIGDAKTPREQAVRLYYAVRDGIRYDPYAFLIVRDRFPASYTLSRGFSYCVPKAVLYAAALRSLGIPARLGFADVKNHLTTKRLQEVMKSDIFNWHGYVSVLLDDQWIKATPVFNIEMCKRFDVLPLEFDGTRDAMMHAFNARQQRHMEYVGYHGEFDDFPFDELRAAMAIDYPEFCEVQTEGPAGNWETEEIHRG